MENFEQIVFYNQWHNGDVFSSKGYVNDIIQKLPQIKYYYAHECHPKVICDINADYIPVSALNFLPPSEETVKLLPDRVDEINKIFIDKINKTIFVDTWIGAYHNLMPPGEEHGNYNSLHRMWQTIYQNLNKIFEENVLSISENPLDYVPSTDFSKYEIKRGVEFTKKHIDKKIHLFCNGQVRSAQNMLGLMKEIIEQLSILFPEDVFICTAKFATQRENIYFAEDIYELQCDINEIAFLSLFADTIIGKNSGPYMFCHLKENLYNKNKCFVSLSLRFSDSYPIHNQGFECNYIHLLNTIDHQAAFNVIRNAILIRSNEKLDDHSRGRVLPLQ